MGKLGCMINKLPAPIQKSYKKVRAIYRKIEKHRYLDKILPGLYDEYKTLPLNEKKIVFIEIRMAEISNSFREMYKELSQNHDFVIRTHFLRDSFVSKSEYYENCKNMLKDIATAKYVFLNEASDVISCINKRPETYIIQLWHGCGAFKKFGMSTAEKIFGLNEKEQKKHPSYKNLNLVTVSSPEVTWAYVEAMCLEKQKEIVKPVGVSRTDVFFKQDVISTAYNRLYEVFPAAKGKKIILFAPTFRGRVADAKTPECFDLNMFAEHFKDEYVVVFKHHPFVKEVPQISKDLEGIFAYDATKTIAIEDLLCVSDICISDYSSLIFEYSLFERPMLFFAYDLDEYYDWRGFYYSYHELTPGPICKTNEEMIDFIEHLNERFDKQQVVDFKNKFMSACDGNATKRIIEMMMSETDAVYC